MIASGDLARTELRNKISILGQEKILLLLLQNSGSLIML